VEGLTGRNGSSEINVDAVGGGDGWGECAASELGVEVSGFQIGREKGLRSGEIFNPFAEGPASDFRGDVAHGSGELRRDGG
jgi:hypothetical protein